MALVSEAKNGHDAASGDHGVGDCGRGGGRLPAAPKQKQRRRRRRSKQPKRSSRRPRAARPARRRPPRARADGQGTRGAWPAAPREATAEAGRSRELPRSPDALSRPRRLGEGQADRRTDDGAVRVLAGRSALHEGRLAPRDQDRRLRVQPDPLHAVRDVHAGGLRKGDVERLRESRRRSAASPGGRSGTPKARTAR